MLMGGENTNRFCPLTPYASPAVLPPPGQPQNKVGIVITK